MEIQEHENKNAFIHMGQIEDATLPQKSILMHYSKIKNYISPSKRSNYPNSIHEKNLELSDSIWILWGLSQIF